MNLVALQTFLTILDAGSLVRAAERLNVTQSTVTARLKALEEDLGQILIVRQKSGATLTAAGLRLKRYAETMSELWRQAKAEVALPDSISTVCNIGCHPDLWPDLGERLFDRIRLDHPEVALSVWHGGQIELSTWLNNGLIDVSLTYWPPGRPEYETKAIAPDEIVLVSTDPSRSTVSDDTYVYAEAGDAFGRWHAVSFADAGVARLSFGSAFLGLQHILAHGGMAYLPKRLADPYLQRRRLHLLVDAPVFTRPAYLAVNVVAKEAWPWFGQIAATVTAV